MKMKKLLVFVLCMAIVASISVAATIAYFTDTDVVTNTFTVGKVEISMDEADTDEYGKKILVEAKDENGNELKDNEGNPVMVDVPRVTANEYKLIPGMEYLKDPTIYVEKDSEDCWLFVKVVNQIENIEADTDRVDVQLTTNGWKTFTPDNQLEGAKYYYKAHTKSNIKAVYPLFNSFTISDSAHNNETNKDDMYLDSYQGKSIVVNAYAIQKAGFDDEQEAWKEGKFQ